jgi:hypothetical protein
MTPLVGGDRGTGSYTTGHPIRLVVIVHIATMYCMVVNPGTMLNITSL